ncbi:hypothetical protein [Thalassiella azotivora]
MPDQLLPFVEQLSTAEDHDQVARWLSRSPAMVVLRDMAQGRLPIEHATLDTAGAHRRARATGIEHLRRLLVSAGVLPPRDEHFARLQREIEARTEALASAHRSVLRRFVTWHTLPRVRSRIAQGRDPESTCSNARNALFGPYRLLADLEAANVPLNALNQPMVDVWMTENPGYVIHTVKFLRWARQQRLAPALDLPKQKMDTPRTFIPHDEHWAAARRCLTDDALPHRLRLAGCLVLLYGQRASTIVRLRRSDVTVTDGVTHIDLGTDSVVLDEPLAGIARDLAVARVPQAQPRGLSRAFNADGDGWLLPGRGPGKRLGDAALRVELTRLGVHTRAGRNTALLALARDVPPMVLCDLLGVGASTAERWRNYAGGSWADYAAERSAKGIN